MWSWRLLPVNWSLLHFKKRLQPLPNGTSFDRLKCLCLWKIGLWLLLWSVKEAPAPGVRWTFFTGSVCFLSLDALVIIEYHRSPNNFLLSNGIFSKKHFSEISIIQSLIHKFLLARILAPPSKDDVIKMSKEKSAILMGHKQPRQDCSQDQRLKEKRVAPFHRLSTTAMEILLSLVLCTHLAPYVRKTQQNRMLVGHLWRPEEYFRGHGYQLWPNITALHCRCILPNPWREKGTICKILKHKMLLVLFLLLVWLVALLIIDIQNIMAQEYRKVSAYREV